MKFTWWWKKIDYKTAGICPACLKISKNFRDYDSANEEEFSKRLCSDCQSEALTIAIEKLETYLESKSLDDLDRMEENWLLLKSKYLPGYWKQVKGRMEKLKELKTTVIN